MVVKTAVGVARGRFAADIVAMLAIATALVTEEAFAGVVIVLMQTGGEALDDYGFNRASSSLEALIARFPRFARVRRSGTIDEVRSEDVRVGDALVVRPGDLVPVDGVVESGSAEVDESTITGEPLPRSKRVGEKLLSGSVNVGPAFEMRAERVSGESQYAKIVDLVRRAQAERPPIQRLADRYAIWFTPITLAVAVLALLITGAVSSFLAVLVVATPCPLILATPLAVISGVNRAAKDGIIVKSGAAIEQIGRGKVVIFDKTGTLTYGTPVIDLIVAFDGRVEELLRLASSLEQMSSHPVAVSMVKEGRERIGALPVATEVSESSGQGVRGRVEGKEVLVGSQGYVEASLRRPFDIPSVPALRDAQLRGGLVSFIAVDGEPAGAIVFTDKLRPGVPSLVQKLRALGVQHTVMLTGDNGTNASVIGREAGIERVEADLLPEQKAREVRRLTDEYGPSVMVGDGINDAPALATATVGVAMGAHGTGISAEAADVVLLVDDVTKVGDGVAIGQRMLRVAKQSIYFGMGGSFVLMAIASLGYIEPAVGAMLQEGLDVAVILNALRAR